MEMPEAISKLARRGVGAERRKVLDEVYDVLIVSKQWRREGSSLSSWAMIDFLKVKWGYIVVAE